MKEKKLYAISDHIGCMSQANCDYVIKHNPRIDSSRIEVCPNCIDIHNISVSTQKRDEIRNKYGIPINKKVFVYGGNLGKPQGIDFLIECLKSQKNNNAIYFLIIGTGTEFTKLDNYAKMSEQNNLKVMSTLPRADFETLVNTCDVGLIFLDKCFTIPNFPSRLLSYMQAKIPVLAVTDVNTDVGKVIVDGGFGWWCESNDIKNFKQKIEDIFKDNLIEKGIKARAYLIDNYSAEKSYEIITKHMN